MTIALVADPSGTSGKIQVGGVDVATAKNTGVLDVPKGIGGTPIFSAYQTSAQTLTSTPTKMLMDSEEVDSHNYFSSGRFTPLIPGYYHIIGAVSGIATNTIAVAIYRNGAQYRRGGYANSLEVVASSLVWLDGIDDYVEIYGYCTSTQAVSAFQDATYFQGYLVRAA